MSSQERKVEVVTDSGSSIRPEYSILKEYPVHILPLNVIFRINGEDVPYSDMMLPPSVFYPKMENSKVLPKTSGAVTGPAEKLYRDLSKKTDQIISIHITSRHSAVWGSAYKAAEMVKDESPNVLIEVVNSKSISLGTWFLAETAAKMSKQGASLEEIKEAVEEKIPKIGLFAALSSIENAVKGGRIPALSGYLASVLRIIPILSVEEGEIKVKSKVRTAGKARAEMVSRIKDLPGVERMTVVHTNCPELAEEVQQALKQFYQDDLPIYEAGPVLGVHTGEGAVGIAFEKD